MDSDSDIATENTENAIKMSHNNKSDKENKQKIEQSPIFSDSDDMEDILPKRLKKSLQYRKRIKTCFSLKNSEMNMTVSNDPSINQAIANNQGPDVLEIQSSSSDENISNTKMNELDNLKHAKITTNAFNIPNISVDDSQVIKSFVTTKPVVTIPLPEKDNIPNIDVEDSKVFESFVAIKPLPNKDNISNNAVDDSKVIEPDVQSKIVRYYYYS